MKEHNPTRHPDLNETYELRDFFLDNSTAGLGAVNTVRSGTASAASREERDSLSEKVRRSEPPVTSLSRGRLAGAPLYVRGNRPGGSRKVWHQPYMGAATRLKIMGDVPPDITFFNIDQNL